MRQILSLTIIVTLCYGLSGQVRSPEQSFHNYRTISVESTVLFQSLKNNRDGINRISIDGWDMTLVDSEIFTEDHVSKDHNGNILSQGLPDILPMNGYTDEGYRVSLTIAPNFTYGFIKLEDDFIYMEPLKRYNKEANLSEVIVYRSSDIKKGAEVTCGYKEFTNAQNRLYPQRLNQIAGVCYDVEYAICNDWLQVNEQGGVAQAEAFATGITNDVNSNYDDEFADELKLVITGFINSTCSTCDPWTNSLDPGTLLNSFRTWALSNLSIPHDVASLWSDRDFGGPTVNTIGLAWVGAVCSSYRYNILQSWISNTGSNAELLRVLTAHELGHNFGAGHDASGSSHIMAPSVQNTSTWSAGSIASIESFYSGIGCLSVCAGSTPQLNFNTYTSSVNESGQTGIGGPCNEPYTDLTRTIGLSVSPEANVQVSISVDGSSTASEGEDFELMTSSLTFTPTGSLSQNITIRVYDDKIEESDETVILNLSITSGTADLGPFDMHTMTINGGSGDLVSSECCSGGGEVIYDDPAASHFQYPTIFRGGSQDAKTRVIIPASDLQALGLTAGEINKIDVYVYAKNSSGDYNNFRIGMIETGFSSLSPSVPWYNTSQVFFGSVTTAVGWVEFNLANSFLWNGTSNLYIDFCFDNTTSSADDNILGFDTGTTNVEGTSFRTGTGTNGCNLNSGSYTLYYDIHPVIRFSQPAGAVVEEAVSSSNGEVPIGNTAHFYSPDDEVMLSIKNIGTTTMNCFDVDIVTSGTGKTNLPFGSMQFSNKTFQIDADNDALYEVTLYYTDSELATWGPNTDILNIIHNPGPISSSTEGTANFVLTSEVLDNIGSGNAQGFKAIIQGPGHLALTNGYDAFDQVTFDDSDFCVEEINRGVVLTNEIGDSYLISVDPSGNLELTALANPMANVESQTNQIYVMTGSRALIFKRSGSNYTKVNVDNDGNIQTTNTSIGSSKSAKLMNGNVYIPQDGAGLIFRNAQSECWKMFVDNGGNLVTSQVPCN
ncbi:MAG: hypothetical protein HKN68_00170 [Saprospiraceae bacterium]|nr:hypothetical protein [Saprospiraceae bacterium]